MSANRQTPRQRLTPGSNRSSVLSGSKRVSSHNTTMSARRLIPASNNDHQTNSSGGITELVDYNLELKFAYNGYLQALMKAKIAKESTTRHEQDFQDQIAVQSEKMYTYEEKLLELREEVSSLQVLEETEENMRNLQQIVRDVGRSMTENNLEQILIKLRNVLDHENRKLHLKNVKPLKTQEEFDQLHKLIRKVTDSSEQLQMSRNFCQVKDLVEEIHRWEEAASSTYRNCESLLELENNLTCELLKSASDNLLYSKSTASGVDKTV